MPIKESVCYKLSLHTHDEEHFHHPQTLKLASSTHSKWILNRDRKHNEIFQKVAKNILQRQNINSQINSRFTRATNLKIGAYVSAPSFVAQKGISKKLQPNRNGPFQTIDQPTDITYKFIDSNNKNCST